MPKDLSVVWTRNQFQVKSQAQAAAQTKCSVGYSCSYPLQSQYSLSPLATSRVATKNTRHSPLTLYLTHLQFCFFLPSLHNIQYILGIMVTMLSVNRSSLGSVPKTCLPGNILYLVETLLSSELFFSGQIHHIWVLFNFETVLMSLDAQKQHYQEIFYSTEARKPLKDTL